MWWRFVPIGSHSATVLSSGIKVYFEDAHSSLSRSPRICSASRVNPSRRKRPTFQLTEHVRQGREHARDHVWIVHRLDRNFRVDGLREEPPRRRPRCKAAGIRRRNATRRWSKESYAATPASLTRISMSVILSRFIARRRANTPATRSHTTRSWRVASGGRSSNLRSIQDVGTRSGCILPMAGCPIVGDRKYGAKSDPAKRLALACLRTAFSASGDGEGNALRLTTAEGSARLMSDSRAAAAAPYQKRVLTRVPKLPP